MSDKQQRGDFYSRIPWEHVTPEQARAHPKGQIGLVLGAIGVFFIAIGLGKGWWIYDLSGDLLIGVFNGIWPLLAGIGLLLRVPWSIYMAVIAAGLSIYALIRGFGEAQSIYYLLETVAYVGILFHLIDGDRPNLIYRHRYRKYSAARDQDHDEDL